MPGIANNESDVVLVRKLQGLDDIFRLGDIDRIMHKITNWTRLGTGIERIAAAEKRCHYRARGLVAKSVSIRTVRFVSFTHCSSGKSHSSLMDLHFSSL